jgi:exodeoxyribonuclease VII small subunit
MGLGGLVTHGGQFSAGSRLRRSSLAKQLDGSTCLERPDDHTEPSRFGMNWCLVEGHKDRYFLDASPTSELGVAGCHPAMTYSADSSPSSRADPSLANQPARETLLTFEKSVEQLNEIVEKLERGDQSLEESLTLFERGVELARAAQAQLDHAEKRVEELLGLDERGNPVVREIERP